MRQSFTAMSNSLLPATFVLLLGCGPQLASAWRPAPGTLPASYLETETGVDAAFELPEPASLLVLGIDPAGTVAVLALDQDPLEPGLHRLTYPDPIPGSTIRTPDFGGPATDAGLQCAALRVRLGGIESASPFDRLFCGPTRMRTNPYTLSDTEPAPPAGRKSRERERSLLMLALREPVTAAEVRAAIAVATAGPAPVTPAALVQQFGARAGYWALLRPNGWPVAGAPE